MLNFTGKFGQWIQKVLNQTLPVIYSAIEIQFLELLDKDGKVWLNSEKNKFCQNLPSLCLFQEFFSLLALDGKT